jgi:hypothetical protein
MDVDNIIASLTNIYVEMLKKKGISPSSRGTEAVKLARGELQKIADNPGNVTSDDLNYTLRILNLIKKNAPKSYTTIARAIQDATGYDALGIPTGAEEDAREDEERASKKTEDAEALISLLDPIADEWTKISKETKDENLKKAMNYIEKIALSEAQELDRWKVLSGIK